jgi:hypothetical protein
MCMFCRSLFVLLYFFFWPLCCVTFFDIMTLITPWFLLSDLLRYTDSDYHFDICCLTFFDIRILITPLVSVVWPSSIYEFWLPLWYLLSDLLRFTDSDYHFGIFKLFLYLSCITKAKYCRRLRWKACSAFQSIRKAIPLSFRRYFQVHISVFLLIRAYILILELAVINVIGLVSSDIALLTGNWTCLTGPPVRKSNISGHQPRLMTYNVVTSLPYRHLCIYCRQWCSTQDSFII